MTALSERFVIGALAWGALMWASVYPWGYWPLAAFSAGVGIHAIVATRAWHDHRVRRLGFALATVVAAIAVQLIALPYETVQRLSPGVDKFFRDSYLGFLPPPLQTLSIEPSATLLSLSLIIAFVLFLCGLMSSLRYLSLEWLVTQLVGLGAAIAVLGVVEKALSLSAGIPRTAGFWDENVLNSFGPFGNRNHFAGWMVMALPLATAFSCAVFAQTCRSHQEGATAWLRWLTTIEASRFVIVVCAVLLMGAALVISGSRSGIGSFAVAMIVLGYLAIRRSASRRTKWLIGSYLGIILVGTIVWAGTNRTVGRFMLAQTDAGGRIAGWKDNARIMTDFPVFGIGIGTYYRAMRLYQTEERHAIHGHAHNEYLQLLAEGGVVVAVPALMTLWIILTGIRRRTGNADDPVTFWIRSGAIAGLAGIAAQSMLDFSLQVPANKVLFVFILAVALHRPRGKASRTRQAVHHRNVSYDAHRV